MTSPEDLDGAIGRLRSLSEELESREARVDLAQLLNDRGCARWRAGDLEGALSDLGEAVRLDPDLAPAYNNRACASAESGDTQRALSDLASALRLDPEFGPASGNLRLLSKVASWSTSAPIMTTVSGAIDAATGKTFLEGLTEFLQENVPVERGFEDCREDAIGDVVTRVLVAAERASVSLADALRSLRKTSTRGWVRSLISTYRRRGGSPPLPEAAPSRPQELTSSVHAIRIEELLERRLHAFLEASRPSVRARRRVVWNVFVGSLQGGIRLTRKEVLASMRAVGVSKRKATDGQILSDLDKIAQVLKAD